MTKYRKKIVNSMKWTGENREQLSNFIGALKVDFFMDMSAKIHTPNGVMRITMGKWVAKHANGNFYAYNEPVTC